MIVKIEKPLLAVHRLLAARKEVPLEVTLAGKGLRSRVWHVRSNRNEYAFKVYQSLDWCLPPGTDAELRRLLTDKGARVPRPYLTSEEFDLPDLSGAWSLDEFILGSPIASRKLGPDWALKFGQTLRILHDLDPELLKDRPDLNQSVPTVITQVFGTDLLTEIERRISVLKPPNVEIFRKIRRALQNDQQGASICHADIHRKQLIAGKKGGDGLTLIDFGEARICSRNWDLAAVLLEFGRDSFEYFAQGYGQEEAKNACVLPYAWCLAVAHASYRRSSISRREAKRFLQATRNMSSL